MNLLSKIAIKACKHSIKAGEELNTEQQEFMIKKLFVNNNIPLQCPHGRPTFFTISKTEIEKRFRRS
jgi:DNA mismatch repair protein MutL